MKNKKIKRILDLSKANDLITTKKIFLIKMDTKMSNIKKITEIKNQNGMKTIRITKIMFKKNENLIKYTEKKTVASINLTYFNNIESISEYINTLPVNKNYSNLIKLNNFYFNNKSQDTFKKYHFLSHSIESNFRLSFLDSLRIILIPSTLFPNFDSRALITFL